MLRRDARLRKEYLYRKGLEAQEAKMHARTEEIGKVLSGTSEHDTVSYALRRDAVGLAKRALYDEGMGGTYTHTTETMLNFLLIFPRPSNQHRRRVWCGRGT